LQFPDYPNVRHFAVGDTDSYKINYKIKTRKGTEALLVISEKAGLEIKKESFLH
jgi:hypothetical protein